MMNEQSLLGKRDNRVPGVHWPWEPSPRERLWLKNQKRFRVNDSKRNIQGQPLVPTHIYKMHMSTCTCHGQCTLISIFIYIFMYTHIQKICKNHLGDNTRRMVNSRATWTVQQDQKGNWERENEEGSQREGRTSCMLSLSCVPTQGTSTRKPSVSIRNRMLVLRLLCAHEST